MEMDIKTMEEKWSGEWKNTGFSRDHHGEIFSIDTPPPHNFRRSSYGTCILIHAPGHRGQVHENERKEWIISGNGQITFIQTWWRIICENRC